MVLLACGGVRPPGLATIFLFTKNCPPESSPSSLSPARVVVYGGIAYIQTTGGSEQRHYQKSQACIISYEPEPCVVVPADYGLPTPLIRALHGQARSFLFQREAHLTLNVVNPHSPCVQSLLNALRPRKASYQFLRRNTQVCHIGNRLKVISMPGRACSLLNLAETGRSCLRRKPCQLHLVQLGIAD